ncbi:Reverse transcriptase [Phytophthora palmivora]|uniref:Reverse transcriptase n=1 Tax=Phytophthora palmivora TaxID=4796 RepID=A0A2P4XZF3_9STRA|nr:Reverse transcriptase [Phytophthora palmivora]
MWCGTFNHAKIVVPVRANFISKGGIVSDRPLHIVSMDFVIPIPRTRRGNTPLSLFQDHFTGFLLAKAMAETGALEVAKVWCSVISHDRDPSFMSEVFQKISEMMQSRSRATLSYRPQANGQQERSVKTMIQTVRVYVEDPLQADSDDIAEKMVYAINNSRDTTRQETPFYLVHGWDARSTM